MTSTQTTTRLRGGSWMIPGKDHRRTVGKATFKGKGLGSTCTSVAYWGRPIHQNLTSQESAVISAVQRFAHRIGFVLSVDKRTWAANGLRTAFYAKDFPEIAAAQAIDNLMEALNFYWTYGRPRINYARAA